MRQFFVDSIFIRSILQLLYSQMAEEDVDTQECFSDVGLKFKPAKWPKINLQLNVKEDLIRSFNLFDKNGLGVVTTDAVKVALRALGHEVDAKENEALKLMFPDGTVIFEEYLHMMSQWILSVDQDLDVKKAFSLFDSDAKGYINLNDLRRVRDLLGYGQEIDDSELTDMLLGAQVKDSEQELKEIYEARQDKTRLRKGQGHVTAEEARAAMAQGALDVAVGGAAAAAAAPALPPPSAGASHRRRVSSSFDSEATDLCVDLDKFKRVLQLESAPPEPI